MAQDEILNAPMLFSRYKDQFSELDYSLMMSSAFDVTAPLTAILLEAQSKGCAVIVNVSLITLDEFYGEQPETSEGETEDE